MYTINHNILYNDYNLFIFSFFVSAKIIYVKYAKFMKLTIFKNKK